MPAMSRCNASLVCGVRDAGDPLARPLVCFSTGSPGSPGGPVSPDLGLVAFGSVLYVDYGAKRETETSQFIGVTL